jgi:hypothetical protein
MLLGSGAYNNIPVEFRVGRAEAQKCGGGDTCMEHESSFLTGQLALEHATYEYEKNAWTFESRGL